MIPWGQSPRNHLSETLDKSSFLVLIFQNGTFLINFTKPSVTRTVLVTFCGEFFLYKSGQNLDELKQEIQDLFVFSAIL